MADDILTRLRGHARKPGHSCLACDAAAEIEQLRNEVDMKGYRLDDAADEIERLRAELVVLRDELRLAGEEARHG